MPVICIQETVGRIWPQGNACVSAITFVLQGVKQLAQRKNTPLVNQVSKWAQTCSRHHPHKSEIISFPFKKKLTLYEREVCMVVLILVLERDFGLYSLDG